MQWAKTQKGFTIVELLIVVVVIAILAAVTIVAFNGISDRAKQSAVQSATQQAYKKILAYAAENVDYPSDLDGIGLKDGNGTTYQYSFDNSVSPKTFCVTVTSRNLSYYQNSTSAINPVQGACPGHGINGLPPNLAVNPSFETAASAVTTRTNITTNPSFETNTTTWGNVNGGTGASVALSSAQAQSGSQSLVYTYGDSTTQDSGPASSFNATSGVTYTVSAWIYAPASISSGLRIITYGTALGNTFRGNATTTTGAWTRISYTVTATANGAMSFAIGKVTSTTDTGKLLYVDSVLVEASAAQSNYFSGATAAATDFGYGWTGITHASQSIETAPNVAGYTVNGNGSVRFQSNVRASSGTSSAHVLLVNNAMNPGLYQGATFSAGTYTFLAKVWIEPGVPATVRLTSQGTGISIGTIGSYPASTTTQGQWVSLRRSFTIPSATNVNSFVYIPGAFNSIGGSFWVDEYAIVAGECTTDTCY